jgi:23S rRNA pseudouridine1911/1915/1917 synthase
VTRWETVERLAGATLASIRPETGRTHQIRVHFSAAEHPILGDRVYGSRETARPSLPPRQMLHARRLGFSHPLTGEPVSAEAPLPADFTAVLSALRAKKNAPAKPARARTRETRNVRRER